MKFTLWQFYINWESGQIWLQWARRSDQFAENHVCITFSGYCTCLFKSSLERACGRWWWDGACLGDINQEVPTDPWRFGEAMGAIYVLNLAGQLGKWWFEAYRVRDWSRFDSDLPSSSYWCKCCMKALDCLYWHFQSHQWLNWQATVYWRQAIQLSR